MSKKATKSARFPQAVEGFVQAEQGQRDAKECVQACEETIKKHEKKLKRKEKKHQEKNGRIFKKLVKDKNTNNDFEFFGKLEVEEQKKIIKELRDINTLIRVEKPYRLTLLEADMPTHVQGCGHEEGQLAAVHGAGLGRVLQDQELGGHVHAHSVWQVQPSSRQHRQRGGCVSRISWRTPRIRWTMRCMDSTTPRCKSCR